MEFRKNGLSCAEANEQDIVQYLSSIGNEPIKIKGNDYWYLSPLRAEKTASFKVNRGLNKWYDHGLGKGGGLIDFAILYHDCSIADFMQMQSGDFSFPKREFLQSFAPAIADPKIEIVAERIIGAAELIHYLLERKIPISIADQYCREITYRFNGKMYYAIGFKNDLGGFEIRNRFFKGSCSPKGITTLKNGAKTLLVFEGFIDFLSYLVITQVMEISAQDYLILNSLAFLEKSVPMMLEYDLIRLFLDNDAAGRKCTLFAQSLDERFKDEGALYKNYEDLNDFLTGNRKAK